MLYITPDYYKDFHCTADLCEDTCCAGWKIVIDKETLKKYRKIHGKFKWRMFRSINWLGGTFRQDKEKRCAFLNDKNLCDLYLEQGEEGFCHTCRSYPRHTEEFEGVREITLSVSCPEVARILMERMSPVTFETREDEIEEEYEDFDPFLFSILEDARAAMIKILQNRELPIRVRAILVNQMACAIQEKIDGQDMFSCSDVIEEYCSDEQIELARTVAEKEAADMEVINLAESGFMLLYELELLKADWDVLLRKTELLLYGNGTEAYGKIRKEFNAWMEAYPEMEIHIEQLLVYFLFTYFPGAVYDGEVCAKTQMTIYCVWMIEELWMARWIENGKSLELVEMTELVYRFSREVEHSDKNLKLVEELLAE